EAYVPKYWWQAKTQRPNHPWKLSIQTQWCPLHEPSVAESTNNPGSLHIPAHPSVYLFFWTPAPPDCIGCRMSLLLIHPEHTARQHLSLCFSVGRANRRDCQPPPQTQPARLSFPLKTP